MNQNRGKYSKRYKGITKKVLDGDCDLCFDKRVVNRKGTGKID